MDTFTFISYDEGEMKVGPDGAHRLVCVTESGAKVAIFGSAQNLENVNTVLDARLPCVVRCKTRTPADYATKRLGHTHWVSEDSTLEAMPRRSKRD
ncbi:MAG: hypothetical protein OXL41_11500 [Nitrospinae bacterium]|nr:hypothetical protein [Nitrospinota bacterium]